MLWRRTVFFTRLELRRERKEESREKAGQGLGYRLVAEVVCSPAG